MTNRKRREMSPLELYSTRTRAKQTSFPRIRQAGSRCSSAGRRSTTSRTPGTPRPTPSLTPRPPPRARGFSVRYVQNIVDVDDKIIRRARELGIDPSDVTRRYERAYLDDMRALRNDSVDCTRAPATTSTKS